MWHGTLFLQQFLCVWRDVIICAVEHSTVHISFCSLFSNTLFTTVRICIGFCDSLFLKSVLYSVLKIQHFPWLTNKHMFFQEDLRKSPQIFQKSRNHFKITRASKVTYSTFPTADSYCIRSSRKKFSSQGDLEPRICGFFFLKAHDAAYFSLFYYMVLSVTQATERQVTLYWLEMIQRKSRVHCRKLPEETEEKYINLSERSQCSG